MYNAYNRRMSSLVPMHGTVVSVQHAQLPAPADVVIEVLAPLLSDRRLQRIDEVVSQRVRSVVAVLEDIVDPHNASAVLRSAEAFGTQEVHVIESMQTFCAAPAVTQGTEKWLDIFLHRSSPYCVEHLHQRGYHVLVADGNAANAASLDELNSLDKLAVVFGNEHSGASAEIRKLSDGTVSIPMRGFVESLNLSVAAAVVLQKATDGREGDLSLQDAQHLRARFMVASIDRAHEIVADYMRRRQAS